MNASRWSRGLLAAALVLACAAPSASAQETEKKVTVEVRNGKVFVNGTERAVDPEGRIELEDENGEEVTVFVRKGRGGRTMAWFDGGPEARAFTFRGVRPDSAEFRVFAEPMREHMERLREQFGEQEREMVRLRGNLALDADRIREEVERGVRSGGFWMGDDPIARFERNEEVRAIEREIRELAAQVRRAEAADRAALEAELDARLRDAFERKQQADRKDAEELAKRLEELRSRLAQRDASRDEVISRRKRELLGQRDALDW